MINFPVPYMCVNSEFAAEAEAAIASYQELEQRYNKLLKSTEYYRKKKDALLQEVKHNQQLNRMAGRNRLRPAQPLEIRGRFICPFRKCRREYGSELALNHHMRLKHNAGTKTERQTFGVPFQPIQRTVALAILRGEEEPPVPIIFPPGYIENLKQQITRD